MSSEETQVRPWLKWFVAGHFVLILLGLIFGAWLMVPLCLWTQNRVLQLPGQLLWLLLSLSPLLGMISLWLPIMRKPYLALAAATPLFYAAVISLNVFEITQCDAL